MTNADEAAIHRASLVELGWTCGPVEMQALDTRFEPMNRVESDKDRRWVFPNAFDLNQLVDTFDELKQFTDPKSTKLKNATMAAGRQIDRTIIARMLGTNYTGKTGATTTAMLAGNLIGVQEGASVNTGMTVAKLIKAQQLMMSYDIDLESEELYCGITSTENASLLREAQVISLDYNERPVLVDGRITKFMGFTFVHSELFGETLSSGDHACPVWAKSGVHLAMWSDIRTKVSERDDLRGIPWQAYIKLMIDACRIEEKKVLSIACDF